MPRIPILRLRRATEALEPPVLTGYAPALALDGLQPGVDNLRYDVHLSRGFVEQTRVHIARLIVRHGDMEGLQAGESLEKVPMNRFIGGPGSKGPTRVEPLDLKPLLTELHVGALNQAKASENLSVDVLARVAVIKFLRVELEAQFAQTLECWRMMLRNLEGFRQEKGQEYRGRVAAFQVQKKIILRKAGRELFHTLREIERETLARMRRSFFGTRGEDEYKLFMNPLLFTEDGRDHYLNAEHYVMLGNFDRDVDRFANVRRIACDFLQSLDLGAEAKEEAKDESNLDRWLNVPDNAMELVGDGNGDDSTLQKRSQNARLQIWADLLEREQLMDHVVASYEVVPLLAEYSPRINAQQLKNALISREERGRVEKLIEEHGKLSPRSLDVAVEKVANSHGADRTKMAARFLSDFLRYHRDLRRLEALNGVVDSANLIGNEKMRELSALNSTLYEFLLRNEQRPAEEKILRHVIVKADVRDSSRLTK